VRFRVCSLSRSFGNVELFNLRPSGALGWKVVRGKLATPRL
jgi:hypothetical protein